MKFHLLLPALLGALLLSACQSTDSPHQVFVKMDTDADGRISLAEANRYILPRIFAVFDRNGDGSVTLVEARQIEPNFDARLFATRDRNHDGRVAFEEFRVVADKEGTVKRMFVEIDRNRDGFLDSAEGEALRKSHPGN
ncbi:MAG: hypothetical protein ACOYOL_10160 [Chthoniobacterales bacterium]